MKKIFSVVFAFMIVAGAFHSYAWAEPVPRFGASQTGVAMFISDVVPNDAVPSISPAEFGGATLAAGAALPAAADLAAHPIWSILAGDGFWGALLIGALGFIWRWLRPSILAYVRQRDLENMFLVCETFVANSTAKYGEGYKAANADGKLTKAEADELFYRTKQDFIIFMQAQGKDVVKLYGDRFIDAMIEFVVSQLKLPKAVTIPLPESSGSAPLPPSVMEGARPA